MKVIGAGYGRTGTKSLKLALEILGYDKCYHMEELLRHPEGMVYWKNAMNKKETDWDTLFRGYQSIVDFPGSLLYKELATFYPEAKIILSVRDPESWYKSAYHTIYSFNPGVMFMAKLMGAAIFSTTGRNLLKVFVLNKQFIWDGYFEGKFKDKAYALQKFKDHIEEVKAFLPQDRLLIHHAQEGWEPLCKFLEKPIPEVPYPRANRQKDFPAYATGIVRETLGWKR